MLSTYVENGGHALVTYFSGLADEDLRLRVDPSGVTPPGAFVDLLGVWTEEAFPLHPAETISLSDGSWGSTWSELVRVTSATSVADFTSGTVAGHPAITSHSFGQGRALYVATSLDEASFASLMADVEVVVRSNQSERFQFVINHSGSAVTVDGHGAELTSGDAVTGSLEVPAGAVRVIRQPLG